MKSYVPHKFYTGDRFDPKKLNENALALYEGMKGVLAQRYTYFQFILDFGAYAAADNANEARRSIEAPFAYEIVDSQLFVDDTSDQTLTLTCSETDWNDLSCAVSTASSPGYSQSSQIQNVKVAASTQVDFDMAVPSADVDRAYAIIKCRYDCFTGLTLPSIPQVASGESVSATEWNTFFTAVEELITDTDSSNSNGDFELNWPKRKGIEVYNWRNVTAADFTTSLSTTAVTYRLTGGTRTVLGLSTGVWSTDVGSATAFVGGVYDNTVGQNMVTVGGAVSNSTIFFTTTTSTINSTTTATDLRASIYTPGGDPNTCESAYIVVYWEQ